MNARSRALPLLLLAAAAASLVPFIGYLTDDSFIYLQFAKHLVQGKGFSFNAGEPTYGATSPLWVFLLALTGKVLPMEAAAPRDASWMPALAWVAKAYGAVFHVLTVWLLTRIGRRLGWDEWTSLGLGLLIAAHAWAMRWALSGMESPLATACVALALYGLAGILLQGRPGWGTGISLGLAALARPECHLLAPLGLLAVWAGAERGFRRAVELLGGVSLVLLPWLVTAWGWFHTVLPNTAAAKSGAWVRPGLAIAAIHAAFQIELVTDALPLALFVLVLAFGSRSTALPGTRGRRLFWSVCAAWPALLILTFALGGVQVVSRYLLPATPCVLLLGMASLRWVVATSAPRRYALALPVFLCAFTLQNALFTCLVGVPSTRAHTRGLRASLVSIGIWARDRTPPGASFAVPDIGAFGYYSDRPVLDLYGLVTPEIAPVVVREGYDAVVRRLLFEKAGRPDYLIDRHAVRARLADGGDETSPYRFIFAREIPNLGITRPGTYYYSVYAIDWKVVDRTRVRIARSGGVGRRGPIARGASGAYTDAGKTAHLRASPRRQASYIQWLILRGSSPVSGLVRAGPRCAAGSSDRSGSGRRSPPA